MQAATRRTISLAAGRRTVLAGCRNAGPIPAVTAGLRGFSSSPAVFDDPPKKSSGILKSILHGSEKAKAEAPSVDGVEGGSTSGASGQYSKLIGRGKYIHEVAKHRVNPSKVDEYKALVAEYYEKVAKNPEIDIKLTGSWEVIVGELDTFYHIWEHGGHGHIGGYGSLDSTLTQLADSKEYADFQKRLAPLIVNRTSQLVQEFSFWPSSPPQVLGGIYEMRSYSLKPGSLLEWENEWKMGLEARRQFVEPIGAWFSQVGQLHEVVHLWRYESLEARKQKRQQAWTVDGWASTVSKTVKLTNSMKAEILKPLAFSPLR